MSKITVLELSKLQFLLIMTQDVRRVTNEISQ